MAQEGIAPFRMEGSEMAGTIDAGQITSGVIDIARLPASVKERYTVVANQVARYALTSSEVQEGDRVKQTDTGIIYSVIDVSHLDSSAGYASEDASNKVDKVTGKGLSTNDLTDGLKAFYDAAALSLTAIKPNCIPVSQVNTFAENAPIYFDGAWKLAKADAPATMGTHVAVSVTGTTFLAVKSGVVTSVSHGLGSAGTKLYVSEGTAGAYISTAPVSYSNPMLIVVNADTFEVLGYNYSEITKNGLFTYECSELLEDEATKLLTASKSGFGTLIVGDNEEFAVFSFQLMARL